MAIAAPASYFVLAPFHTKLGNQLLPVHFLFTSRTENVSAFLDAKLLFNSATGTSILK